MKGFEAANAEPWLEGGPDPRLAKDGEPCDTAEACRSNQCIPVDPNFPEAARRCIASCLVDACPDGLVCTPYGEAQLCMAAPPAAAPTTTAKSSSGCATSRSGPLPGNTTVFGLGLGLAALVLGRRRRDA
jgi:MYXO-CTERM domain-containing protein